ncbi:hypothetical protein SISNIDRAFT_467436 [Sistotremastrum niveocremeum HHB9708]|uniref:Uncharacterized protein n=1 Tax=Sistotremastrum niveocremeum HHB9708 TaxID=1314777 RepID=A0A164SVP6_9AGAM|nr:hypothetical protein SISNIDRAFT_467436 [Sistotremastrum niveocremeum HHB9708]
MVRGVCAQCTRPLNNHRRPTLVRIHVVSSPQSQTHRCNESEMQQVRVVEQNSRMLNSMVSNYHDSIGVVVKPPVYIPSPTGCLNFDRMARKPSVYERWSAVAPAFSVGLVAGLLISLLAGHPAKHRPSSRNSSRSSDASEHDDAESLRSRLRLDESKLDLALEKADLAVRQARLAAEEAQFYSKASKSSSLNSVKATPPLPPPPLLPSLGRQTSDEINHIVSPISSTSLEPETRLMDTQLRHALADADAEHQIKLMEIERQLYSGSTPPMVVRTTSRRSVNRPPGEFPPLATGGLQGGDVNTDVD